MALAMVIFFPEHFIVVSYLEVDVVGRSRGSRVSLKGLVFDRLLALLLRFALLACYAGCWGLGFWRERESEYSYY